ncbi:MAG: hypothetical protein R3F14_22025 [Polyangiaceae bacterium]
MRSCDTDCTSPSAGPITLAPSATTVGVSTTRSPPISSVNCTPFPALTPPISPENPDGAARNIASPLTSIEASSSSHLGGVSVPSANGTGDSRPSIEYTTPLASRPPCLASASSVN